MRQCAWCFLAFVFVSVSATQRDIFRHLRIVSAQSDPEKGTLEEDRHSCRLESTPSVMYLKVGHEHKISVVSGLASFNWTVSNPAVATIVGGPHGRTASVKGVGLGEAEVVVSARHEGHVDTATLTIMGISKRYTVVSWIDRDAVDLDAKALRASDTLKKNLNDPVACHFELLRWYITARAAAVTPDDKLYAKAFLISRTSNAPPPVKLADGFQNDVTRYKLYNDFQIGANGSVIHSAALMGKTKDPCGYLRVKLNGEFHDDNDGGSFWNDTNTMIFQLNEARIGKKAQRMERVIDPTSSGVPWIWSEIAFDKQGVAKVNTQRFPRGLDQEE